METISLQNRVHFLISKFYYLTISQALQCIFFFFFFFASLGKFNYLFLWEINSSRLWWAGKFSFLRTKGLRALVGDIQTLTSFLSLFLPFCFCHHYHLYPFKCVWFGFDVTLIRCQWFLFLCWKTSQDFSFIAFISLLSKFKKQNKTKVWNSNEKEEEERKGGSNIW
jgi:hypothetical protein